MRSKDSREIKMGQLEVKGYRWTFAASATARLQIMRTKGV